jgi:hypothetical protein
MFFDIIHTYPSHNMVKSIKEQLIRASPPVLSSYLYIYSILCPAGLQFIDPLIYNINITGL